MLAQFILLGWILAAGFHVALLAIVLRSNKSFPWFTAFIAVASAQNIGMLLALRFFPAVYPLAYYVSAFVILFILSGVAVELFLKVYGDSRWRPRVVTRRLWRILALAYPLCVLAGVVLYARTKCPILNSARTAEQTILAGLVVTFWILALYSRRWGITWRRHAAGIVSGMVLCLTVDLAGVFVSGLGGKVSAEIAALVWQFAYLGSLLIWYRSFSSPERKIILSPQFKARFALRYQKVAGASQVSIAAPRKRSAYV